MAMTPKELTANIGANIAANKKVGQPTIPTGELEKKAKRVYESVVEVVQNLNAGTASDAEIEAYIKRHRANPNDNKSAIDFKKLETQLRVDTDTTAKAIAERLCNDPYYVKVFKGVRKQIDEAFALFSPEPVIAASSANLQTRLSRAEGGIAPQ